MADAVCSIRVELLSLVASLGFLVSKTGNWILSLKQGDKLKATLEEQEPPRESSLDQEEELMHPRMCGDV